MRPPQRAALKRTLEELHERLSERGPRKLEPNRSSEVDRKGEEDEQPLNEMLQIINSNRNRNDAQLARRVARALEKLEQTPEEYGVCEDCGDDIAPGRLKAMPFAELCVACQQKLDAPRHGPTRKKLTDFHD